MQVSVENYMVHHYPAIDTFPSMAKKILFSAMKNLFYLVKNVEAIVDYFDKG